MIDFGVLMFGDEARVMAVGSAPASRSVNNRTDLCPAEIKIEKWRAETDTRNPAPHEPKYWKLPTRD